MKNEVFKHNPFGLEGIKRVSRNLKNNVQVVADVKTGEMFEQTKVTSLTTVVDELSYTKVYHNYATVIKELSVSGLKLFCYILINIGIKKDYIYLHMKPCLEFAGYNEKSKKSFYAALQELINLNILAEAVEPNKYWVNPNLLFNGSRVDLYDENSKFEQ
jgi:hypothetical protein